MLLSAFLSQRLVRLALVAVVVGCPFAIPVPWLAITRWATGTIVENPGFLTAPVNNQTWFVVFGAICAGWAGIVFYRKRESNSLENSRHPQRMIVFAAVGWFAITLIRGVTAPHFQSMYQELFLQAAFLILFVVAAMQRVGIRELLSFQISLTVIVIPLAVLALMQNGGADPLAYSNVAVGTMEIITGKHLVASTFGHPNYMGSYLAPVMVMALGLNMSPLPWIWRGLGAVSAGLSLLALMAGGTRGPLLAVMLGIIVFIVLSRRAENAWTRRKLLLAFSSVAAAGIAMVSGLAMFPALRPTFDLAERLFASKEVASRAFYWVVGLEMFKDSPVFGIGLGQFDSQFWWALSRMPEIEPGGPWYFMVNSIVRGVRPGAMHNDHLQVLVETGLVGALVWAAMWAGITSQGLHKRRLMDRGGPVADGPADYPYLNAAFMGAFMAVAVDAMFGFPFHLPCSGALFWVALGLWSGVSIGRYAPPGHPSP